jgi:hypothetical protein
MICDLLYATMPKYLPLFMLKIRTKYGLLVEDCPISADMADPPDLQVCHRVPVTVLLTLHTMSSLLLLWVIFFRIHICNY